MSRTHAKYIGSEAAPNGAQLTADGAGGTGWAIHIVTDVFQMSVGGVLSLAVAVSGLGAEIASGAGTITELRARRGVAGTSGTTTIELELNGVVTGDTLSWTSADADNALKTATGISVAYVAGDRISFKVTAAEAGAKDVYLEAD